MSSMLPVALYGLKVPAGDVMVPATVEFPATFRITMAAIDPSAAPEHTGTANGDVPPRATLKIVYDPQGPGDEDEDSEASDDEDEVLKALLQAQGSDDEGEDDEDEDESSSDEEERNGGPSDPSKTKKARKEAALKELMSALADQNDSDHEMDIDGETGVNDSMTKSKAEKGKAKAVPGDSDEDEDGESDDSLDGMEEIVLCTLDPTKKYQQTLDVTVPEDQRAYFKVSGTHAIYLSGNYVVPPEGGPGDNYGEDDEVDYDMSPDEDELEGNDESDELDALEDPRIMEVGSEDDEEAPKLVKKEGSTQKKSKKRTREDSDSEGPAVSLDDIMAKSLKPEGPATNGVTNGEPKLSKKQLKKLKNNAGRAVEAAVDDKDVKKNDATAGAKDMANQKTDKKVQFAKDLEQGPATSAPTGNAQSIKVKIEPKKDESKPKASSGTRTVQGVKIEDRKLGSGRAAKKGDKVSMRYIGKLKDGKVFDANKKGKPFSFTIGKDPVIEGWNIGVAGMSMGGERRLIIPPQLAYGKKNMGDIPPNSELTFDLKMLEVK